ncbi:protein ACCELERATED CELL DEATH 6-like isoform X2 [Prunus avium]|uniref:Protein ACCELERATED CELL DEATH 6-like isoform X2 n=1 Tax=Prunus avium TaxID=42229 RepID=A0A6P5U5E8_PRUAV|nr:protein ACCELERATED CELL DEATH 6-like isoform X2 [Prunus avium]
MNKPSTDYVLVANSQNSMDPRLYKSAKSGDICFLKQLLNENPSLLYQLTPRENTALHIAVQFGHKKVVAEIYSRCRSFLTQQNLDGDTPLHVAARVGCFSIFNDLVREIPFMSQTDFRNENNGMFETLRTGNRGRNTVLHEAVRNGHIKLVEFLLTIDPKLSSIENDAGESPLYLAARGGMFEILNQILKSTASSVHGGSNGQTALHAAVVEKHFDIVEVLLRFKQQLIKETDHQGRTPLYYAASLGQHRMVKRLLEVDTSIAYVLDKEGHSPILVAANKGHTSVIREIIRHCPDSGEICDQYGQNALHMAIVGGQANVVRYILETPELECLINQPDVNGNTPLHLATMERKTWIVYYLMWDGRVHQSSKNKCGQAAFDIDRSIKESSITSPRNIIPEIWGHLGTRNSCLDNFKISPRAEQEEANAVQTYMQMGQTLLMVTTLITTVTFAAAFTMPGGYNNNVGPDQGEALLQSNNDFKWFIITDSIAMTCSIIASCLLFWGAVNSNKSSYVYYFTSAAALTYIALQSTAIAFETGIRAVMPHQQFVKTLGNSVGSAFHVITFMFLSQLVKMFSLPEVCRFFISHFCKLRCKFKNKQ